MQPRRSFIRHLLAVAACALAIPASAQTLGKDYTVIEPAQPTENPAKIEVIEFFSYGCPHCNEFYPVLAPWVAKLPADVQMRKIPISFGRGAWANVARLYYTLETTGDIAKLDGAVFRAIHDERVNLYDDKAMLEWLEKKGVDSKKAGEIYNSFGVMSKTKRGDQLAANNYRIQGVPTLVIDGKYMVSGKEHAEMLAIADKLIAKVRAERGKK